MKKKRTITVEKILGIIFLVWGILSLINAFVVLQKVNDFLWLCYVGLFLIGIGLLLKNDALVQSQLLLLFIPDLLWTLDFITYAFVGSSFLGISDYVFSLTHPLTIIVSLQHLAIVPFALFILQKQSRGMLALPVALGEATLAFILSRALAPEAENLNCVYRFCGSLEFSQPYALWWFVLTCAYIAFTYFCFTLIFRKNKKH